MLRSRSERQFQNEFRAQADQNAPSVLAEEPLSRTPMTGFCFSKNKMDWAYCLQTCDSAQSGKVCRLWRTSFFHLRCPYKLQTRRHHSPEHSNVLEGSVFLDIAASSPFRAICSGGTCRVRSERSVLEEHVVSVQSDLFWRNMSCPFRAICSGGTCRVRSERSVLEELVVSVSRIEVRNRHEAILWRQIPLKRRQTFNILHVVVSQTELFITNAVRAWRVIAVFTSVRTLNLTRKASFGAPGRQLVMSSHLSSGTTGNDRGVPHKKTCLAV
jgi:hypothetical protein